MVVAYYENSGGVVVVDIGVVDGGCGYSFGR